MKKFFVIAAMAVIALAGCTNTPSAEETAADREVLANSFKEIYMNRDLTPEQKEGQMLELYESLYKKHRKDSLGAEIFKRIVTERLWDIKTTEAMFAKASKLIRENDLIKAKVESYRNVANVQPGKPYINIEGTDPASGATLSISDILALGKPVLVDFWASWCGPCKREIINNLIPLAAQDKVNIVGVAVWEDSIDDTRVAMESLGITWPVIYTGGRDDSPSVKYGVSGIPTLFLISPDGTILASGHSIKEFAEMLPTE